MQFFSNIKTKLVTAIVAISLIAIGIDTIINPESEPNPNRSALSSELRTIGSIVQRQSDKTPLKDVEVIIIVSGAPVLTRTGSTGYFEIEIPADTKKVTIELRKEGYENESYPFNLNVDRDITGVLYMNQLQ